MSVKTITIKERVYNKLVKKKRGNESFSDLFERLAEDDRNGRPDIMDFAGILSEEEGEELSREVKRSRKLFDASYRERQKRLERRWKD